MSEYEHERAYLENDIEILEDALRRADDYKDGVYSMSSMLEGTVPDDMDGELEPDLSEIRSKAQTMSELAGDIISTLEAMLSTTRTKLENLHIEELCDDCGAVIVNDDQSLHEDWCEQREADA